MQRLEVSGAVRPIYRSLGFKVLIHKISSVLAISVWTDFVVMCCSRCCLEVPATERCTPSRKACCGNTGTACSRGGKSATLS